MKRLFIACLVCVGVTFASAQTKSFKDTERLYCNAPLRNHFVLPQLDGYNCYTADLHIHTIYSDGEVSPEERVREAWIDGLDIIAITDHIESRRQERNMLKYLKGYSPDKKGFEPINVRVSREIPADERGIVTDLNHPSQLAIETTAKYPEITVIKGAEITRLRVPIGHYCLLFTKDNNKIYDADPAQALRNARKQGAIIVHNHPGWERTSTNYTEFEKKVYAEDLIDGIEVANGAEFYPRIVERAIEKGLFILSATDIHATTLSIFGHQNFYRNMTLVFAKDKSEASLREALLSRRTIGYSAGYIIGEESMLSKFFRASVTATLIGKKGDSYMVTLTNSTSLDYTLSYNGRAIQLPAFRSVTVTLKELKAIFRVDNMIHINYQHPTFELEIKK